MICGSMTLAFAALVAAGAVAGCAADEEVVTTVTTNVETVATTTVATVQTTTQTVAAERERAPQRGGPRVRGVRFSGNGDRALPPIRAPRGGTTLYWRNTGEVFSLFYGDGTLVDSVSERGATFLPTGIHRIDVVASGTWVIEIPRARRAR